MYLLEVITFYLSLLFFQNNVCYGYQVDCKKCYGLGKVFSPNELCRQCNGKRTNQEKYTFDVYADRGIRQGHEIIFQKEGDQKPGHSPGDVVFKVVAQEHPIFRLEGIDLHIDVEISLVEALTGNFEVPISQLDGRELLISNPGVVVKPGDVFVVPKEGFPIYKNSLEYGDMYIHFTIKFPSQPITEEQNIEVRFIVVIS